jgi:hypothetical protein
VVLTTSRPSTANDKRLERCTQDSPSLSNLPFLKPSNGVRPCHLVLQLVSDTPSPEVMGRLDHLVEAVYERFKDRYFKDESTSWLYPLLLSPNPKLFRNSRRSIWYQVSHIMPTFHVRLTTVVGTMRGWKKFTLQNTAPTPERATPTKTRPHLPHLL